MTLTESIAAAERRARDVVIAAIMDDVSICDAALDRYAAVCRLAGRWELVREYGDENAIIRAELARLMEDL